MSAPLLSYYTNKARSDFGISGSLLSVNDAVMSWLSVLLSFNDGHGHIIAFLHCYTDEARSDNGNSEAQLSGIDAMMSCLRL